MPSESFKEFEQNLTDVKRIVSLHNTLSRPNGAGRRGKRGLGHLTRGGIVLLCAAWERYVESVLEEGAAFLGRRHSHATLPAGPRQFVLDYVNHNQTPHTQADLQNNLEAALVAAVQRKTEKLNTPKHAKVQPLFANVLGVVDIAAAWSCGHQPIDNFVVLRGGVAHRGGQAPYVRFAALTNAVASVSEYAAETDNHLSDHLRTLVTPSRRPWNRQTP